jgi:hypothetical protein
LVPVPLRIVKREAFFEMPTCLTKVAQMLVDVAD